MHSIQNGGKIHKKHFECPVNFRDLTYHSTCLILTLILLFSVFTFDPAMPY